MNLSLAYRNLVRGYSTLPRLVSSEWCFPPLQLYLEVTYRCNLRCTFCQFHENPPQDKEHKARELSGDDFQKVIHQVPRWSLVSFSGGEPFIKKGFLDLLHQTSLRNKVHIFTNASRIDSQTARKIVRLGAKHFTHQGIVLVSISLHGLKATHDNLTQTPGAYAAAWNAVQDIIKFRRQADQAYPLIELKTVITPDNVAELYSLFAEAQKSGVDVFNLITLNTLPQTNRLMQTQNTNFQEYPPPPPGLDVLKLQSQLDMIARQQNKRSPQVRTTPQGLSFAQVIDYYNNTFELSKFTCHYPWYGVTVSAHGEVFICPYKHLGNIRDQSLPELLHSPAARKFRNFLHKNNLFPGCLGCCMMTPRIF